jgi:hypothetical protein
VRRLIAAIRDNDEGTVEEAVLQLGRDQEDLRVADPGGRRVRHAVQRAPPAGHELAPDPCPDRVVSYLAMGVFDQPVKRLPSYDPFPPVWRMRCLCSFRAIAACGCRFWWRVGTRGRWYAISRRRALRVLARQLRRELAYFDVTGNWPAG